MLYINLKSIYTDWWFFGQGFQMVIPFEDAKEQTMIAIHQYPTKTTVPREATLANRFEFGWMGVDFSLESL